METAFMRSVGLLICFSNLRERFHGLWNAHVQLVLSFILAQRMQAILALNLAEMIHWRCSCKI
jgi:hypothetical protein